MIDNLNTVKRVDALEIHIAYQDKVIDGLSEMSIKQWAEIKTLNDQITFLKNKLKEFECGANSPAEEDPAPPHF
jgi:SlyX protein